MSSNPKELVKTALYYGGYYWLQEKLSRPKNKRLLIQMFHNVVSDEDKGRHWYNIDPPCAAELEAVIVALKQRFRILTVAEALTEIKHLGDLREPTAALTFDDGYRSNFEIAFPILKRHGIKATIYLPTDWIDGKMRLWWTDLTLRIDRCELTGEKITAVERLLESKLRGTRRAAPNTPAGKERFHEDLGNCLMRMADSARTAMLAQIYRVLGDGEAPPATEPPLSWEQIKEMAAYGIEFGAHTCSHPNLSYLDLAAAEHEIVESRRVIEKRLGTKVTGFAYPYGYDVEGYRRFAEILKKHHFLYAATSWWGYVDKDSDLFLLRRMMLPLSTSQPLLSRSLGQEYCRKRWPVPEPAQSPEPPMVLRRGEGQG